MFHVMINAKAPARMPPGMKIKIKHNKPDLPETRGEVVLHDTSRALVLVTAFTNEGTCTWWIPEKHIEEDPHAPTEQPSYESA